MAALIRTMVVRTMVVIMNGENNCRSEDKNNCRSNDKSNENNIMSNEEHNCPK